MAVLSRVLMLRSRESVMYSAVYLTSGVVTPRSRSEPNDKTMVRAAQVPNALRPIL
jgi:hypothetical protein